MLSVVLLFTGCNVSKKAKAADVDVESLRENSGKMIRITGEKRPDASGRLSGPGKRQPDRRSGGFAPVHPIKLTAGRTVLPRYSQYGRPPASPVGSKAFEESGLFFHP